MKRIAIFRALYLGDMLCIIPTVRAIREAWKDAHMTLVGLPWQHTFAERFNHYFDDFLRFPGWPGLPEQEVNPEHVVAFLRGVQQRRFDIVFQMQGNGTVTNGMCARWNAGRVCGLRRPGAWAPDARYFPESEDTDHEVLRFMKLLRCFDIPARGTHLEFPIRAAEYSTTRKRMAAVGLKAGQFVCLHPGARDERRRWPPENFARVARQLADRGYALVLTGSEAEAALLRTLARIIDRPVLDVVETFGHLPIGELAALVSESRLLVSNDTGLSHIAAALAVPSVVIFSAWSDRGRWKPLAEHMHLTVPHEKAADADFVWSRIVHALGQHPGNASRSAATPVSA